MIEQNPLRRIPEILDERGWVKGEYIIGEHEDEDGFFPGGVCLMGAAGLIDQNDAEFYGTTSPEPDEWISLLSETIREQYSERVDKRFGVPGIEEIIAWFNDDDRTMLDEVKRVCEKAAIKWDEIHI